jgi:hypothetical protein
MDLSAEIDPILLEVSSLRETEVSAAFFKAIQSWKWGESWHGEQEGIQR